MTKYFVYSCTDCNQVNLLKFETGGSNCCIDIKNIKILKEFNDENEAKNYISLFKKDTK